MALSDGNTADKSLTVDVVPKEQLQFFGDEQYETSYFRTLEQLAANGFEWVDIDYTPFHEAALLLYDGPWVAERYLATLPLIEQHSQTLLPVVREIIGAGNRYIATDLFKASYRLEQLKQQCFAQLNAIDCLLTPTAGSLFTVEEMLEEPIVRNTQLGYYTNFMNLLDLAAVSVPTALTANGLPFGVTLASCAFSDRALLSIANRIQQHIALPMGALKQSQTALVDSSPVDDNNCIDVLVCGAHLQGMPLNWQLTQRGATLQCVTKTAPNYRMYVLPGDAPLRPALVRDSEKGAAIDVEIWSVPADNLGSFVSAIAAPLGIGQVLFLC